MKRKICFATGNIWRWCSRNKSLDYVKKLHDAKLIEGIELTIGRLKDLNKFNINKKHLLWIKKLEYRSVHAPFGLVKYSTSEKDLVENLRKIDEVYKQINAHNIVIHPQDLPSLEYLIKFKHWNISIENMIPKSDISHKFLQKIFKLSENKLKMKICLDVAHAYLHSEKELEKLYDKFKGKISQFHLSGTYRKKDHQSMQIVTKKFMKSIECLFNSAEEIPVIIEEDMRVKNFRKLVSEIKYIRSLFS
jgi:sugar phosphate isomerase/epimerase